MNVARSSTVLKGERATQSRAAAHLPPTSSCECLLPKWRLALADVNGVFLRHVSRYGAKKKDSCIWAGYQQTLNIGRNVAGNSTLKDRSRTFQKIRIWRLKADAVSCWGDTKQRNLSSRGSLNLYCCLLYRRALHCPEVWYPWEHICQYRYCLVCFVAECPKR